MIQSLSVILILNVIEIRNGLNFTGKHFDHNQNIFKILIFAFPLRPMVPYKSCGPLLPEGGGWWGSVT